MRNDTTYHVSLSLGSVTVTLSRPVTFSMASWLRDRLRVNNPLVRFERLIRVQSHGGVVD